MGAFMTEYILLNIILSIAVAIYLLKLYGKNYNFNNSLLAIVITSVFHLFFIYFDIGIPLSLLYGPLTYFANNYSRNNIYPLEKRIIHTLPFILFGIYYIVVLFSGFGQFRLSYYILYFISTFISLSAYPFAVYQQMKREKEGPDAKTTMLLVQLNVICILNALFILFLIVSFFKTIDPGFEPRLMVYALLVTSSTLISLYLYRSYFGKKVTILNGDLGNDDNTLVPQTIWKRYQRSLLEEQTLEEYAYKVEEVLSQSKLYLNSGISLEILSKKADIPKHHFSQLLNVYMGKSFYQLVAEYRIQYALQRMSEDDNITIEALAYECGFSSKTSFNKYFKEITGNSPSEYRSLKANAYRAVIC